MSETQERVSYRTLSICSKCALIDNTGRKWVPAHVSELGKMMWLVVDCPKHQRTRTLYCSDVSFFQRSLLYTSENFQVSNSSQSQVWEPQLSDIEDIVSRLRYKEQHKSHLPLIAGIDLFVDGQYISKETIDESIEDYREKYGQGKKFVLKLNAKLATQLGTLNELVTFVAKQMQGSIVFLEGSYERLLLISKRSDSALFLKNVFPSLRVFVPKGEEETCLRQITEIVSFSEKYKGMEVAITITIEEPFPDLKSIFTFLRSKPRVIRVITLEHERSPSSIHPLSLSSNTVAAASTATTTTTTTTTTTASSSNSSSSTSNRPAWVQSIAPEVPLEEVVGNLDMSLLMKVIESDCVGLKSKDFFPLSVCQLLEPFLESLGYGDLSIRPSPFCGYVTCLISQENNITSTPITNYLNVENFYQKMIPLLNERKQKKGFSAWMNSINFVKILKSSLYQNVQITDIIDLLKESERDKLKKKVSMVQFVVLHNLMDIGAVDMSRRCRCTSVITSPYAIGGLSAQCTNCMF